MGGALFRRQSSERKRKGEDPSRLENVKVSIGFHPSLTKKQHTHSKLDRSMSFDSGVMMNRGSSLLGTPPIQHNYDARTSSLLGTPATPTGHMPPPTRSYSERRAEKRTLIDYHNNHRRDSVTFKRQRLSPRDDFPREPVVATPRNEHLHRHHGNMPHSSRQFYDRSSTHNQYTPSHRHDNLDTLDARHFVEAQSKRRMSYQERGVSHEQTPPHLFHRRLSDYSELGGGARTPPVQYREERHRSLTEDGRVVNSRGFRGQSHLNNYRY